MRTLTFRTDRDTERALAQLTEHGRTQSAAIREALLFAAHQRWAERLRAEALGLAADPRDVAEARAVLADIETLRAW